MTRSLRRAVPRVRLVAESLESREGPSSLSDPLALIYSFPIFDGIGLVHNQEPIIHDFRAIVGPNGEVTFTGHVSDDQPVAGTVVQITGQGIELSAIVEADGSFRVTTTVMDIGDITVTATVTDSMGLKSSPVQTIFTPSLSGTGDSTPVISLIPVKAAADGSPTITEARALLGSGSSVTISGTAIDDKSLAGCVVSMKGDGVSESSVMDSKGAFAVTFQRTTSADFVMKVTVCDSDGNTSTPYLVLVSGT